MEAVSSVLSADYQYKFISEPSDDLKCLVCLEVAEDPWQHSKCGKLFCNKCLDDYGRQKPCPNCRMTCPQYFEDSRSKRDIRSLSVRCDNAERRNKCGWVGTVGTLHNHLTTCKFTFIECPNGCLDKDGEIRSFMRKYISRHLPYCPNRNYECEYCGQKGTYITIMEEHDDICEKKIVPCSNSECDDEVERKYLSVHLKYSCQYGIVACKYKNIGCSVELKRKYMEAHEQDSSLHFKMATDVIAELKMQCTSLSTECAALKERNVLINEKVLKNATTLKLSGYQRYKSQQGKFFSPCFYTAPKGYLMQLQVVPYGDQIGAGTHVSVYACFLNGTNDANLSWPFIGLITITLLNQANNSDHHVMIMQVNSTYDMKIGRGFPQFIDHGILTSKAYLMNDSLYFRVSVEATDSKRWLECTV